MNASRDFQLRSDTLYKLRRREFMGQHARVELWEEQKNHLICALKSESTILIAVVSGTCCAI
jgi:hypothetical protein